MTTTDQRKKYEAVDHALLNKWRKPEGQELIREGGKIANYLIDHGPLPVHVADAMLPEEHRATGMIKFFNDRDYGLEVNAAGDIVGAGISLIADERSAVHVSEIKGRRFYNWCVCDIVMFPIVLGLDAPSSTKCPASGETITFTVTQKGLENLSHPDAWFTLAPAHGGDIRKVYCNRVNIYIDREKAEAAVAADSDLACAPIAELWTGTKDLADMF
ncbi:organomercurial lyase [Devosia sediminis]|uniref:Alkylmercury lyase n=1 Tax=Devosia sediminis TaxID=2798801 RepID=A0A934IT87_9HYPH|nr:organomercurial lyase [Devosia sediminis]MBJ3786353.1 hypothetical protein [Devosia sediminis]